MMLPCCCRALTSFSVRMTVYSNFRKLSSRSYAESFKPVKVNSSKLNFNFLLKRHYILPSTGERSRAYDIVPKGFQLIYKVKQPSLFYTLIITPYLVVGFLVWFAVRKYILEIEQEDFSKAFKSPYIHTQFDLILSCIVLVFFATVCFQFGIKTPLRVYRRNDEILAVLMTYLGPFKKKVVYCSINDIRPLEITQFAPFRQFKYDINGKKYYLPDFYFRSVADLNAINNNKEKMRTKWNDFSDLLCEWKSRIVKYVDKYK